MTSCDQLLSLSVFPRFIHIVTYSSTLFIFKIHGIAEDIALMSMAECFPEECEELYSSSSTVCVCVLCMYMHISKSTFIF